jgi:hypothetical protein
MTSYRVCFLNEIARNAKVYRCCQRSILIRLARSPERAIEGAKKRFARLEGIRDWKIHAALIEIEAIDSDATSQSLTDTSAERDGREKDIGDRAGASSADPATRHSGTEYLPPHARPPRRRRRPPKYAMTSSRTRSGE